MKRLSARLAIEENAEVLYQQIIDAAQALMRSDAASLQVYRSETGKLKLLVSNGFHPESAQYWECVETGGGSPCGRALETGERTLVPNIDAFEADPRDIEAFRRSSIMSVQSTPLISRAGDIVGMLSTHWREPFAPKTRELRLFDVLARLAADLIDRNRNEDRIRASEARLRLAVEAADLGIWRWNIGGSILWDRRCKARFGLQPHAKVKSITTS